MHPYHHCEPLTTMVAETMDTEAERNHKHPYHHCEPTPLWWLKQWILKLRGTINIPTITVSPHHYGG